MMEKIIHHSHPEHELELKNYRKPYNCDGCKEQGFGSRYRCEICNYDLHQDCAFTELTSCKLFENCTFKFFNGLCTCSDCLRYCDACGKPINGFVYHCENEGWDLHPCCLNLKPKLMIDGVEFRLKDSKSVSTKCLWCNKRKIKECYETRIPGWSYVSNCKNYCLHVYCATEMLVEGWKNGGNSNNKVNHEDNTQCLALENLELPVQVLKKNRGKGNKYLRIIKVFFKAIACVLLGDPTITLTCLLVDLLA